MFWSKFKRALTVTLKALHTTLKGCACACARVYARGCAIITQKGENRPIILSGLWECFVLLLVRELVRFRCKIRLELTIYDILRAYNSKIFAKPHICKNEFGSTFAGHRIALVNIYFKTCLAD